MNSNTDVFICGAGIAGIASACFLAKRAPGLSITLLERDAPLAMTTAMSGENFRDYWPQACMAHLMRRSIALMTEMAAASGNLFQMKEHGYDFVRQSAQGQIFPSDHLRNQHGRQDIEVIEGAAQIKRRFPYLSDLTRQVVRLNRAGSMDVQALGRLMLKQARQLGVTVVHGELNHITPCADGFELAFEQTESSQHVTCRKLVLAAGPMNAPLAGLLGVDLGIESIVQTKFVMPDPLAVIPRDMPFTIFADPQYINWPDEEHDLLAQDPEFSWLLEEFPAGLHIKPEGGSAIKLGWAFNRKPEVPVWSPLANDLFPSIVLRGVSRMIPALTAYAESPPTPIHQFAGYYTRTKENWPLIGPLSAHDGLYTIAALSGFGTMAACAAGELLAEHIVDAPLPDHARWFHPDRYQDPELVAEMAALESDGQL